MCDGGSSSYLWRYHCQQSSSSAVLLISSNTSGNDDRANIKVAKLPECFQVNQRCLFARLYLKSNVRRKSSNINIEILNEEQIFQQTVQEYFLETCNVKGVQVLTCELH